MNATNLWPNQVAMIHVALITSFALVNTFTDIFEFPLIEATHPYIRKSSEKLCILICKNIEVTNGSVAFNLICRWALFIYFPPKMWATFFRGG